MNICFPFLLLFLCHSWIFGVDSQQGSRCARSGGTEVREHGEVVRTRRSTDSHAAGGAMWCLRAVCLSVSSPPSRHRNNFSRKMSICEMCLFSASTLGETDTHHSDHLDRLWGTLTSGLWSTGCIIAATDLWWETQAILFCCTCCTCYVAASWNSSWHLPRQTWNPAGSSLCAAVAAFYRSTPSLGGLTPTLRPGKALSSLLHWNWWQRYCFFLEQKLV